MLNPLTLREAFSMSHIVTIRTEVKDAEALRLGCDRLGLERPVHRAAKLFTTEATGYCVELPEWKISRGL